MECISSPEIGYDLSSNLSNGGFNDIYYMIKKVRTIYTTEKRFKEAPIYFSIPSKIVKMFPVRTKCFHSLFMLLSITFLNDITLKSFFNILSPS